LGLRVVIGNSRGPFHMDCRSHCRADRSALGLLLAFTISAVIWLAPAGQIAFAQESGDAPAAAAADQEDSLFIHIVKSAGPVFGGLLLLLSVSLVALIVMLALDLRMSIAIPPAFVEQFTDTVNKRKFKEAYDLARADNSFLAKVLTG